MTKKIFSPMAAGMLLLFCGCAHRVSPFDRTDEPFAPQGRTIAVLAGLDNDLSKLSAAYVSDSLKRESSFSVLAQQEIARRLMPYPVNIRGPYTAAYFADRE